jgi:hypothetical protein
MRRLGAGPVAADAHRVASIVWKALVLAVASALAACQTCSDPVPAHPLSEEPAGARCHADADCAGGLPCLEGICAVGCGGNPAPPACPAGTACVLTGLCLPGCASGADCQLGSTAGQCVPAFAGVPAYCFPVSCDTDAECPAGSRCVEASRASGITWKDSCATGWCQR